MKKRKKPYLLVTLLVIVGIAIGVMNTPPSQNSVAQDETPKTGQEVQVDDKPSSIAKDVNEKMASKGAQPTTPEEMMPKLNPNLKASGPLVLKSKSAAQAYKPMPSDSSTSTQWYTEETPKEIKKSDYKPEPQMTTPNSGAPVNR